MFGRTIVVLFALASAACATTFTGDAHFPGGPHACFEKCAADRMEMASFIYSGEFASACVCRPRLVSREPQASACTESDDAAVVGVVMQTQRTAQAQASRR